MNSNEEKNLLQRVQKMAAECDRCGTCLPYCPLFGIRDRELVSARGKNTVGRAIVGSLGLPAREALEAVNFCLLCRACVANCPSGVRTDEIMMDLRRLLLAKTGVRDRRHQLFGMLLGQPLLVSGASRLLSLLRRTGMERFIAPHYTACEMAAPQYLALRSGPAIMAPHQEPSPRPAKSISGKVAYFQGCGMKMFFPQASAATVRILRSITEVTVLNNPCCGLPHLAHGQRDYFIRLSGTNRRLFEEFDHVVTDCASCGSTLKHLPGFFENHPDLTEYETGARKIMDLSEFLIAADYEPRVKGKSLITYHDACHLGRGQGIKKEPRSLLRKAGEYVEMSQADLCCGGAGAFSIDYPEVAGQILAKKQRRIEESGANLVTASCPGCVLQLGRAGKNSGKFQAVHLSQVLEAR